MTNPPKIGLIADDFTGAMDSGAQFSYSELGVHFRLAGQPGGDVEIVNTASREVDEAEAVARTRAACILLNGRSLFKKVDSTLRGHVGAEIQAVLSASPYRKAVLCPATPLQGRTVRGGVLYVHGVPLEQTAFKDDPVHPARTSRIDELLRKPSAHLSLDLMRGPLESLVTAINESTNLLLNADAETADDLLALARAILATSALPCGAFGLARAYLQALDLPSKQRPAFGPGGRTLVLVGSAHQAARDQVARLDSHPECRILKLDADPIRPLSLTPSSQRILVLCANQTQTVRSPEWLRFGQTVSQAALDLLDSFQPETLLAIGGETVTYFCGLTGAESIQVLGEAAPGIPFGRITGGRLNGRLLITKAGGFGNADTLVNILFPTETK